MTEPIGRWLKALDSVDPEQRRRAAEALGARGDPAAIEPLAERLADPDSPVREAVVAALGWLATTHPTEVAQSVVPRIATASPATRSAATQVLASVGPPAEAPARELLGDAGPTLRRIGAELLGRVGTAASAPELQQRLADPDPQVAMAAAESLQRVGHLKVDARLRSLLDGSAWQRAAACTALSGAGPAVCRHVARALRDPEPLVRLAATEAAARIGAPDLLPELLPILESPSSRARAAALRAIAAIVERGGGAALSAFRPLARPEPLVELLAHPEAEVRLLAAELLGSLGDAAAVPALASILTDDRHRDDPELRRHALWALEAIAPRDLAPLVELALDRGRSVEGRCEIADLLGRLGGSRAFETLAELAHEPEPLLRRVAIRQLASAPPEAALPRLIEALEDADGEVRLHAARGLERLLRRGAALAEGPARDTIECLRSWRGGSEVVEVASRILAALDHPDALAALLAWAGDDCPTRRAGALRALAGTGDGRQATRALLQGLSDPEAPVRAAAIHAFAARTDALPVPPGLHRCLKDPVAEVRRAAAQALARAGDEPSRAALVAALKDEPDQRVRAAVARSLARSAGASALPHLVAAAEDPSAGPMVQLAVLESFAALGDSRALPVASALLSHPEPEVRETALRTVMALQVDAARDEEVPAREDRP